MGIPDNYKNFELTEEIKGVIEARILAIRSELHFSSLALAGTPEYSDIEKVYHYIRKRFVYVSDDYQFNKADYWDTESFDKLLYFGILYGDCDDFGYASLEFFYRVLNMKKKDLYRVACAAENGEGHFVSWIRSSDGYLYQVENRLPMFGDRPRTPKFMKEAGYKYWHYSDMTNTKKWYDAIPFISREIYNTPDNLAADEDVISLKTLFAVDRSKTLLKEWSQALIGVGAVAVPTLQSSERYLSQLLDGRTLGIVMIALSIVGAFIRLKTYKRVEQKKGYDA